MTLPTTHGDSVRLMGLVCECYESTHPSGDDPDGAAEMMRVLRAISDGGSVVLESGGPAASALRKFFPDGSDIWDIVKIDSVD